MPKPIDSKVIELIRDAYITRGSRPTLEALAKEFKVGRSTVTNAARKGKWKDVRDSKAALTVEAQIEGAKQYIKTSGLKIDDLHALETMIVDLTTKANSADVKSFEGSANALANLLKVKRELFPPDVDELAEIAVRLGITPNDFLAAIQKRWVEKEQLQRVN